ncbi:retrovirus-related pol polyprotein from transposon TNT 1-94 [Tanacetum coccineum]
MELVLEQTQQGTSYEVSVSAEGVEELKRKVKIKGEKKEALLTLRQKPEHQSDTKVIHNDDGNPSRANIKQALGRFNTTAGNPVKEILLKLNLPDHRLTSISSVRRPSNRDSSLKNSVLSNTKNSSEKEEVSDRLNKKSDVAFKDVDANKKIVTNDDIKNALIAKNVLCVTCAKNLWHRRLSHLNFGTINDLTKHDLVDGLSKFKYGKDHLCSACERGKSKKASHPPKVVPGTHSKLELLHMDLCRPMRVASINGKQYILVIVDDYSRFTWVYFLGTKDETPEIIKNFIARVQLNYNTKVCRIRTDNGIEFKNENLKAHYDKLGIMQQFSIARTPQQNGVVEQSMNIPSKEDLDNLFRPIYEEYFEKRSSDTSINSAAPQVHNHEDSPSTSSNVVE